MIISKLLLYEYLYPQASPQAHREQQQLSLIISFSFGIPEAVMSNLPAHRQSNKVYNPLGALPVHPHFESRYNALANLSNQAGWPRRVNVYEGSFIRTNPAPIYRRSNWFWDALGITTRDGGSSLWQEITLAATSPHTVAYAHALGLPARLSCLVDTNATGKACALYKRANRGAMDGTSIGTASKELAARKWLCAHCTAVIEEINFERQADMGGAGSRQRKSCTLG